MMLSKLLRLINRSIANWFRNPYFGFIQGHSYLSKQALYEVEKMVGVNTDETIQLFENRFSQVIGDGEAVSFASGRMAFFSLVKMLKIGTGDEVILLGSTCAVMVNAVLRAGARPVFSDIDNETLGSSAESIRKCITPHTKIIVAQHSFGIPCEIGPITELAKERSIFLLEDCAISLGSTIDGVPIGGFGDASLFSTDHTKPINTIIGGLIYSKNKIVLTGLRHIRDNAPDLSDKMQRTIFKQLIIERKYCNPSKFGRYFLLNFLQKAQIRFFKKSNPFLEDDFSSNFSHGQNYPYPAKFPSFLAKLGLHELGIWESTTEKRRILLNKLLQVFASYKAISCLPKAYLDKRRNIIPLRFAWAPPDGEKIRMAFSSFLDSESVWFKKPIIGSSEPVENFQYQNGSCPVSESVGVRILNLPCNIDLHDADRLLIILDKILKVSERV